MSVLGVVWLYFVLHASGNEGPIAGRDGTRISTEGLQKDCTFDDEVQLVELWCPEKLCGSHASPIPPTQVSQRRRRGRKRVWLAETSHCSSATRVSYHERGRHPPMPTRWVSVRGKIRTILVARSAGRTATVFHRPTTVGRASYILANLIGLFSSTAAISHCTHHRSYQGRLNYPHKARDSNLKRSNLFKP